MDKRRSPSTCPARNKQIVWSPWRPLTTSWPSRWTSRQSRPRRDHGTSQSAGWTEEAYQDRRESIQAPAPSLPPRPLRSRLWHLQCNEMKTKNRVIRFEGREKGDASFGSNAFTSLSCLARVGAPSFIIKIHYFTNFTSRETFLDCSDCWDRV